VLRRVGRSWRVLLLQRASGVRSPGSWEIVHGSIEPGEAPPDAALREVREETGLAPLRLYSVTVNPFYLNQWGSVQLAIVFAVVVGSERVTLSAEHRAFRWLSVAKARDKLTWPREKEALDHVAWLLRSGDAGTVEDVLLISNDNGE